MAIRTETIPQLVASGSGGSATGTSVSLKPVNGLLLAIGVAQGNTPHANTDITVTMSYGGSKSRTLLTLPDNSTTALTWYDVRELVDSTAGASQSGQFTLLPLDGYVTVSVAQGGSAATCDVVLVYEG